MQDNYDGVLMIDGVMPTVVNTLGCRAPVVFAPDYQANNLVEDAPDVHDRATPGAYELSSASAPRLPCGVVEVGGGLRGLNPSGNI